MAMDTESELTITTETVDVASLSAGDLVHVGFPLPHPRVVSNELRAIRVVRYRRSVVTLVDSEGVEKRFRLSPARSVNRVTNPAIPIGPWNTPEAIGLRVDVSEQVRTWQRDDALWHKLLAPRWRPFVRLWREVLDLQCRVYAVRLGAGFWTAIVLVAIALATRFDPVVAAVASVIGGRLFDPCWERWRRATRRKVASRISIRVRYKPFGPDEMRYATLELRAVREFKLNPPRRFSTTEMQLRDGKRVLATCAFANNNHGGLPCMPNEIARAIRIRVEFETGGAIYAGSTNYDPRHDSLPDIFLSPRDREFECHLPDRQTGRRFSVRLKFHQARVLADALEVMDDMRRL